MEENIAVEMIESGKGVVGRIQKVIMLLKF
jgi:hypothetical protein